VTYTIKLNVPNTPVCQRTFTIDGVNKKGWLSGGDAVNTGQTTSTQQTTSEGSNPPQLPLPVPPPSGYNPPVYPGWVNPPTEPGNYVQVMVDSLNLRTSPSTSAAIVGKLTNGHYYKLLQTSNGWGQLEPPNWQGPTSFGWSFLMGYTRPYQANSSIQSWPLGRWCADKENGTVTCTAVGVTNKTNNPKDPYVGVFELPPGAAGRITQVKFVSGALAITLYGTSACMYINEFNDVESGAYWKARTGFELQGACVKGIEANLNGTTDPTRWSLTYTK
jgi:hypothetical protein